METISAHKSAYRPARQAARCGTGQKQQAKLCPGGLTADGFLRHQFLPLYESGGKILAKKKVEKGLQKSLSTLAEAHGLALIDTRKKSYPYNILLSFWDAKRQLADEHKYMELSMAVKDDGEAVLMTCDTVCNPSRLYYIPVQPLYQLLRNKQQCKAGELLLSVCSYLLRIAGVPYYRDEDSYLYWHCEMIKDWYENDRNAFEGAEYREGISALAQSEFVGDSIGRRIYNPYQLDHFKDRISRFITHNDFEENCLKIAADVFALWQEFPRCNLFSHIPPEQDLEEEDGCNEEPPVRIYEYVSFVGNTEDCLYDQLSEMVNNDFNEKTSIDEPTLIQCYDDSFEKTDTLEFERRLFELIDDLCYLLNNIP